MIDRVWIGTLAALAVATPACLAQVPGQPKAPKTVALEAGAKLLQSSTPLKPFDMYLVGFHPMKEHPERQMEAHHYCHQMNEDFAQCTLFDSNGNNARLNGIEYIISAKLFDSLPAQERASWHPHNGEILSGQLIAPGIPAPAEKALMRQKMNSYGKTWHVWNTGHEGMVGGQLPIGTPVLGWSFNRDGEAIQSMLDRRDRRMGVNMADVRRQRTELQKMAQAQLGVDDLKGKFGRQTRDIPGVAAAPPGPAAPQR